jgi:hypothetical protein
MNTNFGSDKSNQERTCSCRWFPCWSQWGAKLPHQIIYHKIYRTYFCFTEIITGAMFTKINIHINRRMKYSSVPKCFLICFKVMTYRSFSVPLFSVLVVLQWFKMYFSFFCHMISPFSSMYLSHSGWTQAWILKTNKYFAQILFLKFLKNKKVKSKAYQIM